MEASAQKNRIELHVYLHEKYTNTHLGEHVDVRQLKPQHDHERQQRGGNE